MFLKTIVQSRRTSSVTEVLERISRHVEMEQTNVFRYGGVLERISRQL